MTRDPLAMLFFDIGVITTELVAIIVLSTLAVWIKRALRRAK